MDAIIRSLTFSFSNVDIARNRWVLLGVCNESYFRRRGAMTLKEELPIQ